MTDRARSLERSIRTLTLAVVVLAVLQTWSILGPGERPAPAPLVLPSAHASQMELLPDAQRPKMIITSSQSGANIYEWIWDAEKQGWVRTVY